MLFHSLCCFSRWKLLDGFPDWFRTSSRFIFQSFVSKVTRTYSTERIIDPIHRSMEDTIEIDRGYYISKKIVFFGQSNFLAPQNLEL